MSIYAKTRPKCCVERISVMFTVLFILAACSFAGVVGNCATNFDVLRARTEDLGPALYLRASWQDPWLSMIPKETYPEGAGYERSSFQISRSEPASEEETWNAIQPITSNADGACAVTYNQAYVGMHEDKYKPENFGLVGPLICQDDLPMYWRSKDFWQKYFMQLEIRNRKSVINRLGNVYRQYVPKASANSNFAFSPGDIATQPAPSVVDMTVFEANLPTSQLMQGMLDETALQLMQAGAMQPNSNGWITLGESGPIFTLYIGAAMSNQLLLNSSEFRQDYNASYMGFKEANPVIQRLGGSRVIKNFRHLINLFPARWTNATWNSGTHAFNNDAAPGNPLLRVPIWNTSIPGSGLQNKGSNVTLNTQWNDPAIAMYESAEVMSPWVFTEEPIKPINSVAGMKWNVQNYFGEWAFVIGNDALVGFDDCVGIQDPMHKRGRHFAEYRHANHPIFPDFGRMILFKRCANSYDTVTCS